MKLVDDVNYSIHEEKKSKEEELQKARLIRENDMAHNITYALGAFFDSILYIDLDTEIYYMLYKDSEGQMHMKKSEDYTSKAIHQINKVVHKDFLDEVKGIYMPQDVRKVFDKENNIESTHLRWNGKEYRWVRVIVHVAERENGRAKKVVYAFKDVHDQKEKELHLKAKLEAALEEAKEANETKSQFLSNVSHDLRTPMKAIMGISTLMREKESLSKAELIEYLDRIDLASANMLGLINSVLDLSKLENARMELDIREASISSLIDDIEPIIRIQTSEKKHKFVINNKCTKDRVSMDIVKMRQIILNILSNAVKYTEEDGEISLTISNDGNLFKFVIKDNGIGMKPDFLKVIFEPFEREGRARYTDGIGLGMVIVKKLVELCKGTIDIQSELGCGTEVTIKMPLELIDENVVEKNITNKQDGSSEKTYEGYNVLVVEDNEINLFVLNEVLALFKCNIENAFDGLEAVTKVASSEDGYYDLIIMDLKMPNMDGDIATKNIRMLRDRKDVKDIPIIMASADSCVIDEEQLLKSGITEYATKPIDKKHMEYLLDKYLN